MRATKNVIFHTKDYMLDRVVQEVLIVFMDLVSGLISQDVMILGRISQNILVSDLTSIWELDIVDGNIDEDDNNKKFAIILYRHFYNLCSSCCRSC
jgi:hypothetical protein